MKKESSTVVIDKKRYVASTLRMLMGLEDSIPLKEYVTKNPISGDILNIAGIFDKPSSLPILLEVIHNIPKDDNIQVRLALARAQIDAILSMNENLQKYMRQKLVAETIERIIFGDLLIEGKSSKNSGSSNRNDVERKTAKKNTAKKGAVKKKEKSKSAVKKKKEMGAVKENEKSEAKEKSKSAAKKNTAKMGAVKKKKEKSAVKEKRKSVAKKNEKSEAKKTTGTQSASTKKRPVKESGKGK